MSAHAQDRTARLVKSVMRRADGIKVRDIASYGLDCAHCSRDSLVFTGDTLHWKSPHKNGNNVESHPNAITMYTLNSIYFTFADPAVLKALRAMIDEQLEKRAA